MFNLGASLMITRDHVGAVIALERSLDLEPHNTKAMVYLGQASAACRVVLSLGDVLLLSLPARNIILVPKFSRDPVRAT